MRKRPMCLACLGFMLVLVLLRIAGVPLGTPFSDPKYENKAQQGRKVWIAGTIETYEKKSSNNGYVLRGEGSKGKIYLLAKRGDLPVGAAVRVYGTVKKPESPRNPGMFDEKTYYEGKGCAFYVISEQTYQVNRMGVARTFQNIRLFKEMSVIDNIKVGLHESMKYDLASSLIRLPNYWKEEKHCTERAFELLDIFHMADMADTQAGSLPYGAQRRLEIMRALATSPKLLLLDEPAAGMNPSETAELTETIRRIRDEFNIAVLLIEHDMSLVMGICEGIAVLNFGRIIAKGTPDEIRNNPQVIEAYLGKKEG